MTLGISGRSAENITLEAVRSGDIRPEDIRIHPDTLVQQAEVARAHANPQLAANLLRAAELTRLDDHRVLEIYEALRPNRSTSAQLLAITDELVAQGAVLTAELVREALEIYEQRSLLA
jgi:propanediol dehydratase small subunit